MEFKEFKIAFQHQFNALTKNKEKLFLTDVDKNEIWDLYLESFPAGTNPIYKERREFDCNCCKHFIRNYGNVVGIKDNKVISVWDIPGLESPFKEVARSLSKFVKKAPIKNVFLAKQIHLGTDKNIQEFKNDKTTEFLVWEHFYYKIDLSYVNIKKDSIESRQGEFRATKDVFKRSMEELTLEAGEIIKDLIAQNSLYRGEEFKKSVLEFINLKEEYADIPEEEKDVWCWKKSFTSSVCRIRNTALGTLLIDLSDNVDVDVAVTKFEKVMAPTNYKRPKAIYTKKMIEEAQKQLEEMGFIGSLERRFGVLEDVTVNNLLFVNRDARKRLKNSVFDDLKEDIPENTKKFDKKIEEVSITDFMEKVIPTATNIELLMESKHVGNLVSLIAPENKETPSMFKWDNNFSWAYNGNVTDSIKQNVKKAGGNVDGVLRFSLQWNTDEFNPNDFDAHCIEPSKNLIYYMCPYNSSTEGKLDVDITDPKRGIPAVENITWPKEHLMREGRYQFIVHNYSHNGGKTGFSAEIEFAGEIYSFEYANELRQGEKVLVAEINYSKKTGITFIKALNNTVSSKEIWGIKTNKFSKVSIIMHSPNHWDDQDAGGNKHYFFFLDGCINETKPRGFFNEFLNEDLVKHRKVFEALGSKMSVQDSENQLSGLGFSSTQKNSIIAKIEGAFTRTLKINF